MTKVTKVKIFIGLTPIQQQEKKVFLWKEKKIYKGNDLGTGSDDIVIKLFHIASNSGE
jgi:hypothetical protein